MASARDVATFMLQRLIEERMLSQDVAVSEIALRFGEAFVYENQNGNPAIRADVLREFRKLTTDTVVWERGEKLWRFREDYDPPGRSADY